ncbi:MAG: hypothetical protein LBJ01_01590 [Tannerella sp.]|jgi:hypothetical protein|nr:hypothetical protein [Tannerella sp.]
MKTDAIIRRRFFLKILTEEAEIIKNLQDTVVSEFGLESLFDKGSRAFFKGHFDVEARDDIARLTLRYVRHIRYADISLSRKHGLYIYNRIVFGRLYRYTLGKLRYGFLDSVRDQLRRELERAGYDVNSPSMTGFMDTYHS